MAFVKINNAQIYYEDRGQAAALVLIHAGIADSGMWDGQVEPFAARCRVVRYDMRGFGKSTMPPGRFSNVEDLAGLLDQLDIRRAVLLGCSFGGLVALDFALTYPELVAGLILAAPSVSGYPPSARIKDFWEAEEKALESRDLESATELNLRLWVDGPARTPDQVNPELRARVGAMQLAIFQKEIPEGVEEIPADPPAISRLHEVQVPLLLLIGNLDLKEKIDLAVHLAEELPAAELQRIPNTAHMSNMENPEAFNQYVLAFLEKLGYGQAGPYS